MQDNPQGIQLPAEEAAEREQANEALPHPTVTHRLRDAETQIDTSPDIEIPVNHRPVEVNYGSLGF